MSLSEVEGEGCDHVSPILTCPREEQATRGQNIDFFLPQCSAQLRLKIAQIILLIPNTLPLLVQKLTLLLHSMTRIRFLTTRKMSFDIFGDERTSAYADIDQILKPHVKPLLDASE